VNDPEVKITDEVRNEIEILKDFGHFVSAEMIEAWPDVLVGGYVDRPTGRNWFHEELG